MRCLRVGYGMIAPLHELKLGEAGVVTVGVVDRSAAKRAAAAEVGHAVFETVAEAAALEPDLWDVCCDTGHHAAIVAQILAHCPTASIILEKPVCSYYDIPQLRAAVAGAAAKIVVNEQYLSSAVSELVARLLDEHGLQPRRVRVEMSKNRLADFARGRFVDREWGAFGYEGSHMIAVLMQLGPRFEPERVVDIQTAEAVIESPTGPLHLPNQGFTEMRCQSPIGLDIELYTSMQGMARYHYPLFERRLVLEGEQKYRALAIEGLDRDGTPCTVVGFYAPIVGFALGYGAGMVIHDGVVQRVHAPLRDDSFGVHFRRAIDYFRGERDNPAPLEEGIRVVELMHRVAQALHPTRPPAAT